MAPGEFTKQHQAIERHNASIRPALEQQARDRYIRKLKSDTTTYFVDVLARMPDDLVAAIHAFSNNCGPKVSSRLTEVLHSLEDEAIERHVAANWEPQTPSGDYVAGRVAS